MAMKIAVLLGALPVAAIAQPVTPTQFAGTAKIGSETRQVQLHFSCTLSRGRITRIDVDLDLPDAERLKRVFDVNPFEGPTGIGGRMHLAATGTSSSAQVELPANASFGNNGLPSATFTFTASATSEPRFKSSYQQMQDVASVLSSGPSKFTWRADNPVKGGQPIEATADVTDADAARLRAALAPCGRSRAGRG